MTCLEHQRIRILVVDDHPIVRSGLIATLGAEPDMEVVASAATKLVALQLYREHRPDITLMDLGLDRGTGGLDVIQEICRDFPQAKIIVFSALRGDEDVYRALSAGATTFLSKETPDEELVSAIRDVQAGGRPIPQETARKLADRITLPSLTSRETEVLRLVAEGMRNKEIAGLLGIGEETVQGHMKNILSKLKVNDRTKAAITGVRRGIIHLG
jgi:two-component system NarL family response regulator